MAEQSLGGFFWVLILYDVAEEIDLGLVRKFSGIEPPGREPSFRHPTPDYVRFERAPATETAGEIRMDTGEVFRGYLKYFDYGVVSVELQWQFQSDWDTLVRLSSHWSRAPELERKVLELVHRHIDRLKTCLIKPNDAWLSEDYYIVQLSDARDEAGEPLLASRLLSERGAALAQIVRGEHLPLSSREQQEALQSSMSYYPTDLVVAGWIAAFIYDTPESAAPGVQLLGYANAQLLEFRVYDDLLTRVLSQVYKSLEHQRGVFSRWRFAREAAQLNTIRLDVTELTERTDNAIKFLSDMYYARLYRMAAAKIGVPDYRNLVVEKLRIAGELYDSMVNEFHEARTFVLELMVVAILIIELVFLFRGKG